MLESDKREFGERWLVAWELYGKTPSKAMLGLFWETLCKYDFQDFVAAMSAHITNPDTGQYAPKPADLIRALEGSTEDSGNIAWSKVNKAIRLIGPYESVVFDDHIIHAVLSDMGGWQQFGAITEDDLKFRGNEFVKRYQRYKISGVTEYPKKLMGSAEMNNIAENKKIMPPRIMGDHDEAKLVYDNGGIDRAGKVQKEIRRMLDHE